ncbi:MAG: SRPBCC domain-containing protein [Acidobacteria bacterium]|nr:SRPBCC domain-containing protein [Acidobacteriota bacterium]
MELKFRVHSKVGRPVSEVFDAVYNPDKLRRYFTTESASGPLEKGTTVIWRFADYPGDTPVEVTHVVPGKLIVFEWAASEGGYNTRVEMTFEAVDADTTLIGISESGWHQTPEGLTSSYGNCMGWTQMLCCLKAFTEHGINLREGAY